MARPMKHCRRTGHCQGFTYLGVLFALALIGMSLAAAGTVWSLETRRQREQQLLWVGHQFRDAIARYYASAPTGLRQYPRELGELLDDQRGAVLALLLPSMYVDPVTGSPDWQIIRSPDGAILGVASSAMEIPIKRTGFEPVDAAFEQSDCYCNWHFVYLPQLAGTPTALARPQATP